MADLPKTQLLLVDDDDHLREILCLILKQGGFEVQTAANVNEALKLIGSGTFDVLVSDLHMPHEGDGLTVVSAMRHFHPAAVTFIFSAHPEMKKAAAAILAQTDEIIVKSAGVGDIVAVIRNRLETGRAAAPEVVSIATILEEESELTIQDWLARVDCERGILTIPMDDERRSAHLPQLFQDVVSRLRTPLPLGTHALKSPAAVEHGLRRREQGYTAAMMVEESRMLQVSIFQTLQNNLKRVNFSLLMIAVMTIADEVDSQLGQAMSSYIRESTLDGSSMSA